MQKNIEQLRQPAGMQDRDLASTMFLLRPGQSSVQTVKLV